MPVILDRYLSVQTDDELLARRGKLLNMLILIISIADVLTILKDVVFGTVRPEYLAAEIPSLIIFGVLYSYTRRGHRWPPYAFLGFLALVAPYAVREGLASPLVIAVTIPIVMVPLIAPPWLSIPMAAVETIMLLVFRSASDYPHLNPVTVVILGVLGALSWLSSSSLENAFREANRNASALTESNRELQASRAMLETHARELEQRSVQLEASAKVAQAATSILDTDRLMRQVVEVIRERFGLYYVGLFQVDESGQWAELRAGTGEAGQAMLKRAHRLRIGEGSMVGWSIAHSEARVALEAEQDAVRLATAELPHTRSEAALPLRSRGRVVGALTVQSAQPAAFDQSTTVVLQTMADQVAVALDNARLFSEAEAALEAMRRAYSQLSREAWVELLRIRPGLGYRSSQRGVAPAGGIQRIEIEQALQGQGTTREDNPAAEVGYPLAVPIKVRGNVLGVLDTYKPIDAGVWTPEEVALIETLADQVGVALESARLYTDAQRRAAHERLVSEITDKLRRAVDMDDLLQTTVREMAAALDVPGAFVQLSAPPEMARDKESL